MNRWRVRECYLGLLCAVLLLPAWAWSKADDRDQAMTIDSTTSDCNLVGDQGRCRFSGEVVIEQGTLEIHADQADVIQKNGGIDRVLIEGKQATLKQQMDDGTWMNARADHMEYNVDSEIITLTGNYRIESARGSNTGQRMVYDTRSGTMQSGGDGTRVRTVLPPRTRPPANSDQRRSDATQTAPSAAENP